MPGTVLVRDRAADIDWQLTLATYAALGDVDRLRVYLGYPQLARDPDLLQKTFRAAAEWRQNDAAEFVLDRCIALDPELHRRIASWRGREPFIEYFGVDNQGHEYGTLWQSLAVNEVRRAIRENDPASFDRWLQNEAWILDDAHVDLQAGLIENAALNDRGKLIDRLFHLHPAILGRQPPPSARAIEFAVEYGYAHLVPLLQRLWPVPDDLPYAAGTGDFARVRRWFDPEGKPSLGNPAHHHRGRGPGGVQDVLDGALAWACMKKHLDIAAFLADHGADIHTKWSTHEPASILHECACMETTKPRNS